MSRKRRASPTAAKSDPSRRHSPEQPASELPASSRLLWSGVVAVTAIVIAVVLSSRWIPVDDLRVRFHEEPQTDNEESEPPPPLPIEDDPASDGWPTEAFNLAASEQLATLKAILFDPAADAGGMADVLADGFATEPLRPIGLIEAYRDGSLLVRRMDKELTPSDSEQKGLRGLDGLRVASTALAGLLGSATEHHAAIKIFQIDAAESEVKTTALLEASARDERRAAQVKAFWRMAWTRPPAGQPPKLLSIAVEDYEEVVAEGPDFVRFVECGPSILSGDTCYERQFLVGLDQWMEQLPRFSGMVRWGDQGGALGDANGDGLDDLYVCEPAGLPNRLFVRQADGTMRDASSSAGVDFIDHSRAALFIDFDNDGDQDLIVATTPELVFLENDGTGKFTIRVARDDMKDAHSLAAADYDHDGWLDLFACAYHGDDNAPDVYPLPLPYNDATNGGRDRLFRNLGGWRIEDVTEAVGMDVDNHRWGLAASWEDYDDDGDPDLYIANDFGRNQLYRNDRGRFRDVAAEAGVEDVGSGMSVAWGDYDRDGQMDLYVSNMFSTAGGRITSQAGFRELSSPDSKSAYQRMSTGNSLFHNVGNGEFRNVSRTAAVDMARWAWGAAFADINNDGWSDLLVTNGFITREDERDL